jgi:hypothetical protein
MIYYKIQRGYVMQHFDSETGDCTQQEFFPDEAAPPERQDQQGNIIPEANQVELANTEKEVPLDMVQP